MGVVEDEDVVDGVGVEGEDCLCFCWYGEEGGDIVLKEGVSEGTNTDRGVSVSISPSLQLSLESPADMFSFWNNKNEIILCNSQ